MFFIWRLIAVGLALMRVCEGWRIEVMGWDLRGYLRGFNIQ
jgi:hypothetical protein